LKLACRAVAGALLVGCASPHALAQPSDCAANADACVRWAIAEVATFIDECGKIYPGDKPLLDSSLSQWPVLKLPIPQLQEALDPRSAIRTQMTGRISQYLGRIPSYEREIECSGRLELLRSKEPALMSDSVRLPRDILGKYRAPVDRSGK
jgi:hypothetical protein